MRYFIQRNIAVLDTGGFLMQKIYVENFPIPPKNNDEIYDALVKLCTEALNLRSQGEETSSIEELIDLQVYTMFDFTNDEIQFIEDAIGAELHR